MSFRSVAAASTVRITLKAPNFPLVDTPLDIGGAVAQSELDSVGSSRSFASFPYPGEFVATAPGLAAGGWTQTGVSIVPFPELPTNPLYVSSDLQQPEASTSAGPVVLRSSSAPERTSADATVAGDAMAGESTADSASYVRPDGSVGAEAAASASAVVAGPVRFATVRANAKANRSPEGRLSRSSELLVSGMTVGDVAVGLTPEGLVLAGTAIPVGSNVTSALEATGIDVSWVAARDTENGIISAGVQIVYQFRDLPRLGSGSLTYVIGQVSAAVAGSTMPAGIDSSALEPSSFVDGNSEWLSTALPGASPETPQSSAMRPSAAIGAGSERMPGPWGVLPVYLAATAAGILAVGRVALISFERRRQPWRY